MTSTAIGLRGRCWPSSGRRVFAALALLAVPGAAVLLAWAAAGLWATVRAPGPASVDLLVALTAAGAASVTLAAVTLTGAVGLVGLVARRTERAWARTAAGLTPAMLRRLAEVALGIALVGGPATAATASVADLAPVGPTATAQSATAQPATTQHATAQHATTQPAEAGDDVPALPSLDRPAGPAAAPVPSGGWRPDRPTVIRRTPPSGVRLVAASPRLERAHRDTVVVRRGDSLWLIVGRYLGPSASATEVAAEWPRWYAANRSVIGPDPGLLQPGQQLAPPPTPAH